MRHRKAGKRLGRTWEHRKAMFRNMARSLLTHEQIRTTETKAKELRKLADRLITFGLENDLNARRKAYKVLENHQLVKKLFEDIAPRYSDVSGGYTRVVKLGAPRRGDSAPMAMIEFVVPATPEPEPKKTAKKAAKSPGPAKAKKAPAKKKTEEPKDETSSASEEKPVEKSQAKAEAPAEEDASQEPEVQEEAAAAESKETVSEGGGEEGTEDAEKK